MLEQEFTVNSLVGTDTKNTTMFIQKAVSFQSNIWFVFEDKTVNAKSLLGMLSINLKPGCKITLFADGIDEKEAISELIKLL